MMKIRKQWMKKVGIVIVISAFLTACGKTDEPVMTETMVNESLENESVNTGPVGDETQEGEESVSDTAQANEESVSDKEFETAQEAVKKMTLGWNVGNALDSNNSSISGDPSEWETAWGSSVITPELIAEVKASGFQVIRLPVSWQDHMDENNQVSEEWMNRVDEVVNYILDEDMYCILNVHHDCGAGDAAWLKADADNLDAITDRFKALWIQIATRFKDYDEKLIFEGYNELLDENDQWSSTDEDGYYALNQIAQTFVDTVRSTGGYNEQRNLIVNTYSADSGELSVSSFELPKDPAEGHLMAEVHIYAPGRFTTNGDWITDPTSEFDEECAKELDEIFARLDQYFISKGTPVVVGEFGAQSKDNDGQRALYANYFVRQAGEYGMSCIWWDDCGDMELIQRRGLLWTQPGIRNALLAGAEGKEDFEMETVSEEALAALNLFEEPEYAGISLDKETWKIETYANMDGINAMIDGDITTAWANQEAQIPDTENQWIKVDLGESQELNRVTLWTPNRDYTRAYEVYTSEDGENWELIASGDGNREFTDIDFENVTTRYIRINQTGEAQNNWWSVYELSIYCMDK